MTPSQISEAQNLAAEWDAAHKAKLQKLMDEISAKIK